MMSGDCPRGSASANGAIVQSPITHPITKSPITQSPMLLLLLLALTAACGANSYAKDHHWKMHVGIVFDIGGKDDRSFNAAAWRGVHCAETGTFPDGTDCGKPALGVVVRDGEQGEHVR